MICTTGRLKSAALASIPRVGAELRGLALWHDADSDGISEPGEVRPVTLHGIAALSYEYQEGDGCAFAAVSQRGARMQSGDVRPTYDVILRPVAFRDTE